MELKDYVVSVINDLFGAIQELQDKHCQTETQNDAVICPSLIDTERSLCGVRGENRSVTNINFDVVLTVSEGVQKDKNGGMSLKILSASAKSESSTMNEIAQRVSFSIPIVYPSVKTIGRVVKAPKISGIH